MRSCRVHSSSLPLHFLWGHPEPGFCPITGTATSEFLSSAFLFLSALFPLFPWIPFRCLFYVSLFSFGRVRVCICSINKCNVLCPRVCACGGWGGEGVALEWGEPRDSQADRQGGKGFVRGERCLAATPPHVPELRVCVYEALNAV